MSEKSLVDKVDGWIRNGIITRTLAEEIYKEIMGIDEETWEKNFLRHTLAMFPGTAIPPIIRNTFGGTPVSINGSSIIIDLIALAATGKIIEVGENPVGAVDQMPGWRMSYQHQFISSNIDRTNDQDGDADCFSGLQLGYIETFPYVNAPANPCIQGRFLTVPPYFQLYVAKGDSSTPSTKINAVGLSTQLYEGKLIIEHKPGEYARAKWFDDIIAELSDVTKLPEPGVTWLKGASYIISSGGVSWGPRLVASPLNILFRD